MDEWNLAAHTPAVLVTVAAAEGSVPRGPGTRMMVAADSFAGTVGGGHLELRAIASARAMLAQAAPPARIERFPLGPSLGQCCGGVVWLVFEALEPEHASLLADRRRSDSWRLTALDGAGSSLFDAGGVLLAGAPGPAFDRTRGTHVMRVEGARYLVAQVDTARHHLLLFGAGHVGTALIGALAPLPCTVTWIDERADSFPPAASIPANVTVEASDAPEDLVAAAPDGASYLVMTHSHALDQRISEAILARQQVGWFGLIGSHTKRMQFEHRLRARGFDADRIAAMACPIGLPGIGGKEPAVIAASVAAQLLMLWQAGMPATASSITMAGAA